MASNLTFHAADLAFVRNVVARVVGDTDAPDVAQEAVLRAFLKRDQFRGEAGYRTWLYRVALTTALGHLRTRHRRQPLLEIPETATADAPSAEEHVAALQTRRRIQAEVTALRPQLRDVVALHYARDLSAAEVARELGISVANVKVRAFRAREILRQTLMAA